MDAIIKIKLWRGWVEVHCPILGFSLSCNVS